MRADGGAYGVPTIEGCATDSCEGHFAQRQLPSPGKALSDDLRQAELQRSEWWALRVMRGL